MFSEGRETVVVVVGIVVLVVVVLAVVVEVRVYVLHDRVDPVVVAVRLGKQESLRDTVRRETSGGGRGLSVLGAWDLGCPREELQQEPVAFDHTRYMWTVDCTWDLSEGQIHDSKRGYRTGSS